MRPSGTYRGARRNEAKIHRNELRRDPEYLVRCSPQQRDNLRTVSGMALSYAQVLQINKMRAAREKAAAAA